MSVVSVGFVFSQYFLQKACPSGNEFLHGLVDPKRAKLSPHFGGRLDDILMDGELTVGTGMKMVQC